MRPLSISLKTSTRISVHVQCVLVRPTPGTVRASSGQRYWAPVTATAIVIASISVGLYVANRERTLAQQLREVRRLANKLFDINTEVRQLPGSTKVRQLIVDTSLEYLRRLMVDAQNDPGLGLEVASAYMSVAQVEGLTTGPILDSWTTPSEI